MDSAGSGREVGMGIKGIGVTSERAQALNKQTAVTGQPKTVSTSANKFQMPPMAQIADVGGMRLAVIARNLNGLRKTPPTSKSNAAKIRTLIKKLSDENVHVYYPAMVKDCNLERLIL